MMNQAATASVEPKAYKHGFDGAWAPNAAGIGRSSSQVGFSVGVFQWLPKSGGKGLKKSSVKVRIKGDIHDHEKVYAAAREVCAKLDSGWTPDKRSITMPMSRAAMKPKKSRAVTGVGSIGLVRLLGWWEEYRCGCVSETTRYKKDLLGYCPKHGENRRYAHKDFEQSNS